MTKKNRRYSAPYDFLVTFPERLYPFANEVEGQWVRGIRSYDRALARAFRKNGHGHYGVKLELYRSVFHVLGSVAVIVLAAFLSQDVFGTKIALYTVLCLTAVFIAFQEFYLQPRTFRQLWRKGIIDWLGWVAPIVVYLFLR